MKISETENLVLVSQAWSDRMIDMFEAETGHRICAHCGDEFGSSDDANVCHECREAVKYGGVK